MPRRFNDRYFNESTPVSPDTFNPVIAEIDRAIDSLEQTRIEWLEQVDLFNANALKRFNDAVQPIVDQLRSAVDGGFLVAQTNDNVALVVGEDVNFYVPEEARVAFRPTPFLSIMAPDVANDWAIARTTVYNEVTGLLTVEILYLHGSGAIRTGWTVSASSGIVDAVNQWMTEVSAMRDQVSDWRDEVAQKWADVNTAAILIAGGPVSSVSGLTGVISAAALRAAASLQQQHPTLDALALFDADGLLVQTDEGTFAAREIAGTADEIDVTNGSGVAGNILIALAASAKAAGKQTIPVLAGAMRARTTNGAASGTSEKSTNKNMFVTLDFDASTQEFAQFFIPMPKQWDKGFIEFKAIWSHAATASNFGVAWSLAGVAISDDEAGDAAFGTAVVVTDTGGTTDKLYHSTVSANVTIAGTIADEDFLMFQVARVPADAGDTMAIDARLHAIVLYINTSSGNDA